ncbi:MAG: hypothetical protein K9N47_05655 [Prosthecobacter sp.]|uniref:hypothetical protein n=1 Tax=Prosthecobacter sp. TaxID=1965333 RepID=UPI0025E9F1D8|nr:hypothetical protein [Prosthecobacter sp.]MCF7785586.1 hypothetical protein [Prosthecobacter sp.]
MQAQPLTLKRLMSLPPQAVTRVNLQRASSALSTMKPATVFLRDDSERDHLKACVQQLEAEAAQARQETAAAQQLLRDHASQAWLEAEARLQRQAMERRVQLQEHRNTSRVRDNTLPDLAPHVVATTDAVHLALPLNPRTAIPMDLPVLTLIKNWLFRRR